MKITTISAVNFKGRTFHYELGPCTAIVGRNFSGKTAILDAIRLCLLGHIPEIGKTNAATWELSSGLEMLVCAHTDEKPISRRLWKDGGSVKADAAGDIYSAADFPLLNAAEYFGLTDTQRIDYVFSRAQLPEDYTSTGIIATLERISFGDQHTETLEGAKATIIKLVRDALTQEGDNLNESLADLVADKGPLKCIFSSWNASAKNSIGAVRTLTELKLREGECSADTLAQLDAEIASAQAAKAELDEALGKHLQRLEEAERVRRRRETIQKQLDAIPADLKEQLAAARESSRLSARKVKVLDEEAHRNARNDYRDIQGVIAKHVANHLAATERIEELSKKLQELEHAESCPFCKSKKKGWKGTAAREHLDAIALLKGKQAAASDLTKRSEFESNEIEKWLGEYDSQHSLNETLRAHIAQQDRRIAELDGMANNRATLANELASLKLVEVGVLAMVEEGLRNAKAAINTLMTRKTAAITLQHDLRRAAQAGLEHDQAAAYIVVIKEVGVKLKEIRSAMVEKVFTGLLEVANPIVGGILKSPLAFHSGDVGRWENTKFVTHRAMSGTEQALAYIAIGTALSSKSPIKLAILDEMGRLDIVNQERALDALRAAQQAGKVDQVIVVGTALPRVPLSLWDTIDLDPAPGKESVR